MRLRRPGKLAPLSRQYSYWDERLRREGFLDAEDRRTGRLRRYTGSHIGQGEAGLREKPSVEGRSKREASAIAKVSRSTYFQMVGRFLHDHAFESPSERRVWEMHAAGASLPETVRRTRLTMYRVREIRERLKREMLHRHR
jgi:hypothetical protein